MTDVSGLIQKKFNQLKGDAEAVQVAARNTASIADVAGVKTEDIKKFVIRGIGTGLGAIAAGNAASYALEVLSYTPTILNWITPVASYLMPGPSGLIVAALVAITTVTGKSIPALVKEYDIKGIVSFIYKLVSGEIAANEFDKKLAERDIEEIVKVLGDETKTSMQLATLYYFDDRNNVKDMCESAELVTIDASGEIVAAGGGAGVSVVAEAAGGAAAGGQGGDDPGLISSQDAEPGTQIIDDTDETGYEGQMTMDGVTEAEEARAAREALLIQAGSYSGIVGAFKRYNKNVTDNVCFTHELETSVSNLDALMLLFGRDELDKDKGNVKTYINETLENVNEMITMYGKEKIPENWRGYEIIGRATELIEKNTDGDDDTSLVPSVASTDDDDDDVSLPVSRRGTKRGRDDGEDGNNAKKPRAAGGKRKKQRTLRKRKGKDTKTSKKGKKRVASTKRRVRFLRKVTSKKRVVKKGKKKTTLRRK